jgi:cell fate regulator YaaT (PSP1 superfamily)
MTEILEVGFKRERKEYYLNPLNIPFTVDEYAIVGAERGEDMGRVLQKGRLPQPKKGREPLDNVLRKATGEDLKRLQELRDKEESIFQTCKTKITEHNLAMKLVDVEYRFDGHKITFYFTADKRIDFRALVKDLAAIYRTRIEMHQIGVREEARRIGGYGCCGLKLCCTTIIEDFEPVTTQMAKDQNLILTPSKLSGACGRLMCCLAYEWNLYKTEMERFPQVGKKITTEKGKGKIERADIFRNLIYIGYESGVEEKMTLEEYENLKRKKKVPAEHTNIK